MSPLRRGFAVTGSDAAKAAGAIGGKRAQRIAELTHLLSELAPRLARRVAAEKHPADCRHCAPERKLLTQAAVLLSEAPASRWSPEEAAEMSRKAVEAKRRKAAERAAKGET